MVTDLSSAQLFVVIRRSRKDASRAYPVARMPDGKIIPLTWGQYREARLPASALAQVA